jgi:hypothetical protein
VLSGPRPDPDSTDRRPHTFPDVEVEQEVYSAYSREVINLANLRAKPTLLDI